MADPGPFKTKSQSPVLDFASDAGVAELPKSRPRIWITMWSPRPRCGSEVSTLHFLGNEVVTPLPGQSGSFDCPLSQLELCASVRTVLGGDEEGLDDALPTAELTTEPAERGSSPPRPAHLSQSRRRRIDVRHLVRVSSLWILIAPRPGLVRIHISTCVHLPLSYRTSAAVVRQQLRQGLLPVHCRSV